MQIVKVIDGDTFRIKTKEGFVLAIRLANINAPDRGYFHYKESKQYLIEILGKAQKIDIQYIKTDSYNRLICDVKVDTIKDTLSEHLIAEGYAIEYAKYSNSTILQTLQERANELKLGLWAEDKALKMQYVFQKNIT